MLRGVGTALQLAGAAVALVAAISALVSLVDVQVVLILISISVGVGGFINLCLMLMVKVIYALLHRHARNAETERDVAYLISFFVSIPMTVIALFLCRHEVSPSPTTYETQMLAWEGAICIVIVVLLVGRHYDDRHARRHKVCPECASTVPSRARLCRECWHRFKPVV